MLAAKTVVALGSWFCEIISSQCFHAKVKPSVDLRF